MARILLVYVVIGAIVLAVAIARKSLKSKLIAPPTPRLLLAIVAWPLLIFGFLAGEL